MFKKHPSLELPRLERHETPVDEGTSSICWWTDEALFARTGVRVAFSERTGGTSEEGYSSLNLATHVQDDRSRVLHNRDRFLHAMELDGTPIVVPSQVHGDRVLSLDNSSPDAVEAFRHEAEKGADALLVQSRGVGALLNFADCVPLIMVAPSGHFCVIHAGWRGVDNGIAALALRRLVLAEPGLSVDAAQVNVYRGAYIHAECFECGADVHRRFTDQFGSSVAWDDTHIDLGRALDLTLERAGIDPARIADVGCCTVCDNEHWFSYRAQGGTCGRHAAFCAAV